jgi:hypothetical protein
MSPIGIPMKKEDAITKKDGLENYLEIPGV